MKETKMKKIPGASKHSGIFFIRRSLGEGGLLEAMPIVR